MPVTAVRTAVSPGRIRPSGPKLCVQSAHWYAFLKEARLFRRHPIRLSRQHGSTRPTSYVATPVVWVTRTPGTRTALVAMLNPRSADAGEDGRLRLPR